MISWESVTRIDPSATADGTDLMTRESNRRERKTGQILPSLRHREFEDAPDKNSRDVNVRTLAS